MHTLLNSCSCMSLCQYVTIYVHARGPLIRVCMCTHAHVNVYLAQHHSGRDSSPIVRSYICRLCMLCVHVHVNVYLALRCFSRQPLPGVLTGDHQDHIASCVPNIRLP